MTPDRYEEFVRYAAAYVQGESVGRYGDPARLARADYFRDQDYLPEAIIGAGWACRILIHPVNEETLSETSEENYNESERLNGFLDRIVNAQSLQELGNHLDDFLESVLKKYYDFKDGVPVLK